MCCPESSLGRKARGRWDGVRKGAPLVNNNMRCGLVQLQMWSTLMLSLSMLAPVSPMSIHVGYFGMADGLLTQEYWSAFGVAITGANLSAPSGVSYSYSRVWVSPNSTTNCTQSAQELVNSSVHVVVSTVNTECVAASMAIFASAKIPLMSAFTLSESTLLGAAGKEFLFKLSPSERVEGQALAAALNHLNYTSMSYLSINSRGTSSIAEGLNSSTIDFGREATIITNDVFDRNSSAFIDEALTEIVNVGTAFNLLDVAGFYSATAAFRSIVHRNPRVTGRGWVWLLSSQAVASLIQAQEADLSLILQGSVAAVPAVTDQTSDLWLNYSTPLEVHPEFSSGIATCRILRDNFVVHVPFRAQVIDSIRLLEEIAARRDGLSGILQGMNHSLIRSEIYTGLIGFNSSENALNSLSGDLFYFTSDRVPAQPRMNIVSFDGNRWLPVASWTPGGSLTMTAEDIIWPGFSLEVPAELAPGFRPRFKIGFLYINGTGELRDDNLGREFLSAFNVSILHIQANSTSRVLFDPVPVGVNTEADCEAAARMLRNEVHAIIGGYRSSCTSAAAKVLAEEVVPLAQVGYGATLDELSDATRFKYFLRVVPPDRFQGQALADLIHHFGWPRVSILYTNNTLYALGLNDSFVRATDGSLLNSTVITVSAAMPQNLNDPSANATIDAALNAIVKSETRVVLLLVYSSLAERIVVRGRRDGGRQPTNGWIWVGTDSSTAFAPDAGPVRDAVTGMVGTRPKGGNGFVYLRLLSEWLQLNQTDNPGVVFRAGGSQTQPFVPEVFDAVSAVEYALTDLLQRKSISQLSSRLTIRRKLFDQLLSYNSSAKGFFGAIGSTIFFDENRNGPAEYDIVNFQGGQWRNVGDWIQSRAMGRLDLNLLTILPSGEIAPVRESPPTFDVLYVAIFNEGDIRLSKELDLVRQIAIQYIDNENLFSVRLNISTFVPKGKDLATACGQPIVDHVLTEQRKAGGAVYMAVIGLVQSQCSISCSNAFQSNNISIPLISFGATAAELSNKTLHPTFFRTCPGDGNQALVARDIVRRYNWSKIGIIATDEPYGRGLANALNRALDDLDEVTTMPVVLFNHSADYDGILNAVRKLRDLNTGVNFISAFTEESKLVLRAADEMGMLAEGWTWLGGDGLTALEFNASEQVKFQSLVGSSLIIGNGSVFDFLSNQYAVQARDRDLSPRGNVVFPEGRSVATPRFASQLFDSITILAVGMSQLWNSREIINIQLDNDSDLDERLRWLTNARHSIIRRLKNSTSRTEIDGAIGLPVRFNENQDGPAAYNVLNYFGTQWQVVGEHYQTSQNFTVSQTLDIVRRIVWSGGRTTPHGSEPPTDPPTQAEEADGTGKNEIIAYVIIGIVVAAGMGLLLFHAFRKTRGPDGTASFSPVT